MKKNIKILTMTLAVALILGAAIGISASAETTAPEIISQNVEYGGNYALLYAVKADSVVGDSVSIAVYDNAECKGEALFTDSIETKAENTENVQGVSCYVFTTNGIAAKNMDTQYYVKVSADNGETVKRYSVAEYLYERLYKNGVAYSNDPGDVKRAELYNTVLLYGKQAQDVLYNLDTNTENDRDYFVTDMKYVYVVDDAAKIDGTFSSGIVLGGTEITLSGNTTASKWDLYDLTTGELIKTIAAGDTFIADTHVMAKEFITRRGSGLNAKDALTYDGKAFTEIADITHRGSGINASVVNIDGNDAAKFDVSWSGHAYDRYSIKKNGTENNLVFETDIYLPKNSSTAAFSLVATSNLSGDAGIWAGTINIAYDADSGYNYVYIRGAAEKENWFVIPAGEWCNIRVEYDSLDPNSEFRLYGNGQLISKANLHQSMKGMVGMQLQFPGAFVGTVYLDNTYCGSLK